MHHRKSLRSAIIVTVLFALTNTLCVSSNAADKITRDPNAGPQVEQAAVETDVLAGDPRLARKVTLSTARQSVVKIVTDLEAATGIDLRAGYNSKDWQVRDRRMNIFAKDLPLKTLMESMARVMKFKWSRGGKAPDWTYRLYMDRRSLLDEESKRQRDQQQREEAQAKARKTGLDGYAKLASLTPEQAEKLRSENPFGCFLVKTGLAKPFAYLFGQIPGITEALATGQQMSITAGSLPPESRKGLADAITELYKAASHFDDSGGASDAELQKMLSRIDELCIGTNERLDQMNPQDAWPILGELSIRMPGDDRMQIGNLPLFDPVSELSKAIGDMFLLGLDKGVGIDEARKNMTEQEQQAFSERMMAAMAADTKDKNPVEPPVEHPDEPALHNKIKLEIKSMNLKDVQNALERASQLAIVSDSFIPSRPMGFIGSKEMALKDLLEWIGEVYAYNWDKQGGVIEFRDRKWYQKRSLQIPDAWIEVWRASAKKTSTLSLDELAEIGSLTMQQFQANLDGDEVLSSGDLSDLMYSKRDILQWYGALDGAQKQAVFSQGGLNLRALSPAQWELTRKLLNARKPAWLEDQDRRLTMRATSEPKDAVTKYQFTISAGEDQEEKWTLKAPYFKPKEEQPKPK